MKFRLAPDDAAFLVKVWGALRQGRGTLPLAEMAEFIEGVGAKGVPRFLSDDGQFVAFVPSESGEEAILVYAALEEPQAPEATGELVREVAEAAGYEIVRAYAENEALDRTGLTYDGVLRRVSGPSGALLDLRLFSMIPRQETSHGGTIREGHAEVDRDGIPDGSPGEGGDSPPLSPDAGGGTDPGPTSG